MFFPGSRYLNAGTYTVTTSAGVTVTVTKIPPPLNAPLLGYHRRLQGQRLDLIANRYLSDPTAFWQLCDANGSVVPDALATHALVAIPGKGS
jgi:hypothetical protein